MIEYANQLIQNGQLDFLLWVTFSIGLIIGGILGIVWSQLFK